ncbi:MAG: RnfABCDGE type electron transport complex subunit D [Phycisphaerae bacterium]
MTQANASNTQAKAKPKPKKKLIQKQANMIRVLYALAPVALAGVYFFGWRSLAVLASAIVAGFATEYLTSRQRGQPVSTACFVTCSLYGLSLPPTIPYWHAAVGAVVAILFGKEVFGGFGRNFANPAIVGRAFVYVAFPPALTKGFVPSYQGFPGGFARWSMITHGLPEYLDGKIASVADAVSAATPMWARRDFAYEATWGDSLNMLLGNIGRTFETQTGQVRALAAGSIGEVSAAIIILAGIYLIWTKTANWRLTLSTLLGATVTNLLFRTLLGYDGVPPLHFTLTAGAMMYAAVFMVTDPVSGPKQKPAQWAYGFIIGFFIVFLRWRNSFAGAVAFAILLGNLLAPLLDEGAKSYDTWKKARAEKSKPAAQGGEA